VFIGHFAAGFAAKRALPQASLGTRLLAATFVDLLWPIFLILGLERVRIDPGNTAFTPLAFVHYPFTHSIPGGLVWGAILGGAWYLRHRIARGVWVLIAAVLSHWVLDAISHRPDMPVLPSGPYVGLALWNSVAATIAVEVGLFAAGLATYVRATRARDRVGRWALAGLVAFLAVIYAINASAPPPPSERALAYGALVGWLLRVPRFRVPRNPAPCGRGGQGKRGL